MLLLKSLGLDMHRKILWSEEQSGHLDLSDQAFKPELSTLLLMDASSKPMFFSEKPPLPQWGLPGPHPTPRSTTRATQQYWWTALVDTVLVSPALVDTQTDQPKGQFGSKPRTSLMASVAA